MPYSVEGQAKVEQNKGGTQVAVTGFICSIVFSMGFVTYMFWALTPTKYLNALHITYYPDRYWAAALPAMLIMFFFYYFIAYMCLILITTYPLSDGGCITDEDKKKETEIKLGTMSDAKHSVAPWVDIPVEVASKLLYQPWKKAR